MSACAPSAYAPRPTHHISPPPAVVSLASTSAVEPVRPSLRPRRLGDGPVISMFRRERRAMQRLQDGCRDAVDCRVRVRARCVLGGSSPCCSPSCQAVVCSQLPSKSPRTVGSTTYYDKVEHKAQQLWTGGGVTEGARWPGLGRKVQGSARGRKLQSRQPPTGIVLSHKSIVCAVHGKVRAK